MLFIINPGADWVPRTGLLCNYKEGMIKKKPFIFWFNPVAFNWTVASITNLNLLFTESLERITFCFN